MKDKILKILDKSFLIFVIVSSSFFLAMSINSFLAVKFFSLSDKVYSNNSTTQIAKPVFIDYSKIRFLFEEDKVILPEESKQDYTENSESRNYDVLDDVELIGTIIFSKKRLALININGKSKIVKENENVDGLIILHIDKYFVKVSKNGKIYIIKSKLGKKITKTSSNTSHQSKSYIDEDKEVYKISRLLVQKETADVGNLLKDVRLIPVVKNNQTLGFKFVYINPRSLLYKYGLRSGDMILSVNGMPVRTAEEAFKIYNMLRNENVINIEIDRRGKRKVITYEIQ